MTEQLTFTIETETAEKLRKMADAERRSLSNLICRLLEATIKGGDGVKHETNKESD
ncbi:ribbon-helix-helix protein, CopG family [Candidatus Pacearchaeota archaeon]|nr:ribbon-helix-helix protein, CopG family [Candidatus Pacearchaeota archaeon]